MTGATYASDVAQRNTILRALVGSTVHGVALDNTDDRDEMGVCLEPATHVIGLQRFEHWVYRTQPEGVRSGPGDLDLTVYSLRKWCRLALAGNPTILLLLHVPETDCVTVTGPGRKLRANWEWFASRKAGRAYLGYMVAQRQRLTGERGQMRVNRPELIEAHGFDTKYAGHVIRLGYQGVEFLETGRVTLPMPAEQRETVLAIRRGETDLSSVLMLAHELEQRIEALLSTSPLPSEPNFAAVDGFLVEAYSSWWEATA